MIFIFGGIFFLILLGIVVYILKKENSYDELDIASWQSEWEKIKMLAKSKDEFAQRQAVIAADNLFDKLLKHRGIGGSSLGERLKIIQSRYPALRQVWSAHLLRNRLVHESSYKLKNNEAEKAIKIFAKGFKELGLNLN